jgi:hypothetical protein
MGSLLFFLGGKKHSVPQMTVVILKCPVIKFSKDNPGGSWGISLILQGKIPIEKGSESSYSGGEL